MSAFRAVDATGGAAALAGYLRAVKELPSAGEELAHTVALLGVGPGSRVLDIGCALGDDVLHLAGVVGPEGLAVGLDASADFLAEAAAAARAAGVAAHFVLGDAQALPFPDGDFDAVRTERTLQHVEDPAAAVAEMVRVTRPGGAIAVSEPDWGTLVIDVDPAEMSAAVAAGVERHFRHPRLGRRLRRMLTEAGLDDVRVLPHTICFTDAALTASLLALADAGAAPEWLHELERRGREGSFFAAATGFLAAGRVRGRASRG